MPYALLTALLCAVIVGALVMNVRRLRKRLSEASRDGHWQRIIEALPQLTWTATPDGLADYFSPQSATFTGLAEDALLGWGWLEAIHPDERASSREAWTRAVAEGREYHAEHRFRRFDGEYRWFSCLGTPIRDDAGRIRQWAGVSIDVTERRAVEDRAQRARRQLELTMRLSQSSILEYALVDGDVSRSRLVPDDYLQVQGRDRSALGDRDFAATLSAMGVLPEQRESVRRAFQACVDGETPDFEFEVQVRSNDGSLRWRLVRGTTTHDASGKPILVTGVGMDITELKRAEEAGHALKEQLERAILGSRAHTWHHELVDGTMEGATSVYTNMWESFGYEPQDLDFASSNALLMTPEDAESFNAAVHSFLAGHDREWDREVRVRHKDGTDRWHLARGVVERDPVSGRALRYTGCSVDITDLKLTEQKLREREEQLRATFENAAVGMAVSAPGGRLVECNQKLCDILGYTKEEIVGHAFTQFGPPEKEASELALHAAFLRGELPSFSRDKQYVRKDGSSWWANVSASVLRRDEEGKPVQALVVMQDISVRKSLEHDLQVTKELLELGIRGSDLSIFDFDFPDGDFQKSGVSFVNFWEVLGYDPADVPHGHDEAAAFLMSAEDRLLSRQAIMAYLNGEVPRFEVEHRLRKKDGSLRWVLARGAAVRDAAGVPIRLIGSHVDITERKRVEERLRESEQRWRSLTETLPQLVWTATTDGALDYLSDQACEYTGVPEPQLLGDQWAAIIHPDDLRLTAELWRASVEQQTLHEVQHRLRGRDGSYRWFTTRAEPARDTTGRVFKWVGSSTDITTLKGLEEELLHAKERLELAIRSSNLSIWEYEMPDGVLETAHPTLTNVWEPLGYDLANPPPAMISIIHPEDLPRVAEEIGAYLAGQVGTFETEHRVRREDGTYRWVLGRGVALRDPSGKPNRFVGTSVDITDIKSIEADLQRAREAAETANRAKDEFLANVSHEIRTPMNAILGMTELALDSARSDHQRQLLSTVKSAARNLLGIINDLLDFSKIAAGKLALDEVDFWLRAEVRETLRALAPRAHRKGLELICHIHPEVPDALFGDAGRVRQVLMNLVGNALKFTLRGEVVVEVTNATDEAGIESQGGLAPLVFTIRDTGIGVARDKQAAIFRAFEQADSSTTRQYGGTGLGLTISAQLATLMGGAITVESELGRGSTFTFTARFARSSRTDQPATASPELLEGLRVLVVDDNETNRGILREWLTSWRMRPTVVGDAQSAFEELARGEEEGTPHSLVLLDGRMPDGDGVTVAAQIMERHGASTPLILLSSDDSPQLAARSREIGVRAYLLKPVQQSDLLETIWTVMHATSGDPSANLRGPEGPSELPRRPRVAALRVLVAEDNELNAALLKTLLDKRGHRSQFAGDGRTALQRATQEPFDVVLLDLHMPEMDGFEVVRAIRERERTTGKHMPIVALTARSSNRDRDRCLAAGMDDFLPKPIEADALWAAIDRLTEAFPPTPVRESRLLDARAILRACAGEPDVLEALCDVFRRALPDHMSRVRSALTDRDLPGLAEAAHKLFGTLGAFSTIAGAVALTVEDAAKRHDLESCVELVEQLDAMSSELLEDTRWLTLDGLTL